MSHDLDEMRAAIARGWGAGASGNCAPGERHERGGLPRHLGGDAPPGAPSRWSNFKSPPISWQNSSPAARAVRVSDTVLAEAYFALQAFYQIPKSDALEVIVSSFVTAAWSSASATKVLAIPNLANAKPPPPPGFVDRLIHGSALADGHTLRHLRKSRPQAPFRELLQARA
ncbi:MAG: hypothetical protein U1F77_16235 [Kiritimatiellia bacterium]